VEKLADSIVVLLLELQTGPYDALLESQRLVGYQVGDDLEDVVIRLARVFERVL